MTIEERLHRIERLVAMQTMEMWSASDLAILLNCSVKHIHNMVSKNEIPYFKNGKLWFRRKDIEAHFAKNPILSNAQLLSEAITHVKTHKLN